MESLIPIIHNLQQVSEAIGRDGFRLPRIVMVGSQGSGKSSVLENIVGRSFLPKGTGVVTRTPLVLHLVHSPQQPGPQRRPEDGTLDAEEYGVFLHSDAIFTDFDEICREIQRQTEKIAGNNKRIGEEEITLKLYSPRLADMTLVDLPGLTKLPVGDQPRDVETRTRNLVLKYIDNTDAIIMAVLTANNDMATNESLKLAKDVDPEGARTLAVLTKVDLMDAGTDATDILLGRVIPVKLGIVAVINRSQKDIDDKKPIEQVYKDEAQFLRKNYQSLADRNGTTFLVATLKKLFLEHTQEYVVNVQKRVEVMISQTEALVDFYSEDDEDIDRGLLKIIMEFASTYSETIRASALNINSTVLGREQRIFQILHETFKTELTRIIPRERAHISNDLNRGYGHVLNDEKGIVQELPIERFKETSRSCTELVYEEMKQCLWECAYERFLLVQKFPALRVKLLDLLETLLRTQYNCAVNIIRQETFQEFGSKMLCIRRFDKCELLDEKDFRKLSTTEKCDLITKLLQSCFDTARRTVHDVVAATIMQKLVHGFKNMVLDHLMLEFSSPGTGRIFHGAQDFSESQVREKKSLEALYKSRRIITEELNTSIASSMVQLSSLQFADRGEPALTSVPCQCASRITNSM